MLLRQEELWWRQRAKEEWLKQGDRNTKFFHACANSKRRKNFVGTIVDEMGQKRDSPEGVEHICGLFQQLIYSRPDRGLGPVSTTSGRPN
jgi:hypothetical protein